MLAGGDLARLGTLVDLCSANPAAAIGATAPAIAVGEPLHAVLVQEVGGLPLPVATWRAGRLVQRRGAAPTTPISSCAPTGAVS